MDKNNLPIKYWEQSDLAKAREKARKENYLRDAPQTAYCRECVYNEICQKPKPCHILRYQPYIVYHILQALSSKGIVIQKVSLKKPSGKIRIEIKGYPKLILNPSFFRNGRECKQNLGIILGRNPDYKHFTTISAGESLLRNEIEYKKDSLILHLIKTCQNSEDFGFQSNIKTENLGKYPSFCGENYENKTEKVVDLSGKNLNETLNGENFRGTNREWSWARMIDELVSNITQV